ncbi:MAG: Gldg family protein [Gammaproteobacteria bacterium]|nr:Gldg family protein [Gammaproteobacteria bacterium]
MILSIARYELLRLLRSPAAWGIAAVMSLVAGLFFRAYVLAFLETQAGAEGQASLGAQIVAPYVGVLSLLLLLFLPLLAMASLAGERRAGSLSLWLASRAGAAAIVLGKYLALLAWTWGLLFVLALPALSLRLGGPLDAGQCLAAFGGLALFAAAVLAVLLAASAWCSQPAVAAGLGLGLLLPLWLVESATLHARGLSLFAAETMSLLGHLRRPREGLIDSADPAYYLLLTFLGLAFALAGLAREHQPWRRLWPRLALAALSFLLLLPASQLWRLRTDVSANGWHSLSAGTRELLSSLKGAPALRFYLSDGELRQDLRRQLAPFQAARPDFALDFVEAAQAEADGLAKGAALRLSLGQGVVDLPYPFRGRAEDVLAQALRRLARRGQRWVVFVEGHGERDAFGGLPRDLGQFRSRLEQQGLTVVAQGLSRLQTLPDNTGLAILASPASRLPEHDREVLRRYLRAGGALLYLLDPEPVPAEHELLAELGLSRLAGTILDPAGSRRGTPHPAVALVERAEAHALSEGLNNLLALPWAAALETRPDAGWKAAPLLRSDKDSWLELGDLDHGPRFEPELGEAAGPFSLAWTLERPLGGKTQRALVVGDGNFLSDGALGNYGNAELGLRAVDWLLAEASTPAGSPRQRVDASLQPSAALDFLRDWAFPWLFPGLSLSLAIGLALWRRR